MTDPLQPTVHDVLWLRSGPATLRSQRGRNDDAKDLTVGDMMVIVLLTAGVCLAAALVGAVALRLVRARSLGWSIVVAALVPLLAVTASVVLNVQLMFISAHDSTAVSVALGCATLIGVLLSFWLGRSIAQGSRHLTTALRSLGSGPGPGDPRRPVSAVDRQPGEIAAFGAELEVTRERLATAQHRANALEDSRRELVAFLSHDLRTPLAGLRALTEGLEDGVVEDRPEALRQMRQTVDRMTGLVGDLFELSRLHSGALGRPPSRAMVSLVELTGDVTSELVAHARRREVALRLELPDDDDRLAVRGNGDELARALTNLVGNAVRHTPPGGTVAVTAARAEDGRIDVAVTDGCGGIADRDLARVFDVGWRATPERAATDAGAGLGLAIAKGVIEAHAGSIAVENVPGGCRFGVVLPRDSVG
ncbi:MAG: HAMP domain-containing sensor histidine kinase [Lapillicoccus sp.]